MPLPGVLTEFTDQDSLLRIRGPFAVGHGAIGGNIETELEVALGELVVSALSLVNGILPLPEEIVAMDDMRDVLLKPWIDGEDSLRVKGRSGHGVRRSDIDGERG